MIVNNSNKISFSTFHDESGGGNSSGLLVNTTRLMAYGSYLVKSNEAICNLLDNLNTAISGISNSWGDADGQLLVSNFSSFVTAAKEIGTEMDKLGHFAINEAIKYNSILTESLRMMNGGGG